MIEKGYDVPFYRKLSMLSYAGLCSDLATQHIYKEAG